MSQHTSESFLFEDLWPKTVVCQFDSTQRTSDAGAALLGAIDRKLKLTESLCSPLSDARDQSRVVHSYHDLVRQRVFFDRTRLCGRKRQRALVKTPR